MVACGGDLSADRLPIDADRDGYTNDVDLNDQVPYQMPIILLHGRDSNTETFYGVATAIAAGENDDYNLTDEKKQRYTNPENHELLSIAEGRLGDYLTRQLGYQKNKNLFAFQYPNVDMVWKNAALLEQYVENLVAAASTGDPGTAHFVEPDYLFATKEDRANKRAKFILIGHSMGGLVSRYYIENITDQYVAKLITVCTPHYGSDMSERVGNFGVVLKPCDVDLMSDSCLFGARKKPLRDMPAWMDQEDDQYAYLNQSSSLNGNHNTNVEYYAIGGYDANVTYDGDRPNNELLENVSEKMQEALFHGQPVCVEFDIDIQSKWAFQDGINAKINALSCAQYDEPSEFTFTDSDGDNIVDYMSQFAVRFSTLGKNTGYQKIKKATLIITSGYHLLNHYHSQIALEPLMHEAVRRYIAAGNS